MTKSIWIACLLLPLVACSGQKPANKWENLDYGSVARRAHEYDYDYTQPSVYNCVDDDLYNCNR